MLCVQIGIYVNAPTTINLTDKQLYHSDDRTMTSRILRIVLRCELDASLDVASGFSTCHSARPHHAGQSWTRTRATLCLSLPRFRSWERMPVTVGRHQRMCDNGSGTREVLWYPVLLPRHQHGGRSSAQTRALSQHATKPSASSVLQCWLYHGKSLV